MLPSQRDQFEMPREVCYLNAASWSPLPREVQEAGRAGVGLKGRPWLLAADFGAQQHERARRAAAALIGADPADIALVSSVGYGVSTAGKILRIAPDTRVLVLEEDHTSPSLEWMTRAPEGGYTVEAVKVGADGDWTAAVLAAIERPGAVPVALASISSVHWSDGGLLDVEAIAQALRRHGAALLVDATHHAGVLPIDVRRLDPDFLVFPTYKWVLGPYGRAFLYVARRHQDGVPLEQTAFGRRSIAAERFPYLADTRFVEGARRYDMGERDHFVSLQMASTGMEMMAAWGHQAILARLTMLTKLLSEGVAGLDVTVPDERIRAPHVLSLGFRGGVPPAVIERLAQQNVYVAPRLGRMRISPHVYNDEEDVARFCDALRSVLVRQAA